MRARRKTAESSLQREALTPGEARFVESMGLYFESNGIPRIGGRSLGLLMISEGPVSLDLMAELLHVSRASISTNMRQFFQLGLCENFSLPGDRRHYYVFSESAWNNHMRRSIAGLRTLIDMMGAGIEALPPGRTRARARLRDTRALFGFLEEEIVSLLDRWESLSAPARSRRR